LAFQAECGGFLLSFSFAFFTPVLEVGVSKDSDGLHVLQEVPNIEGWFG
jgi:hypothetical protein